MQKGGTKKALRKSQHQKRPGYEFKMEPLPDFQPREYPGGKLRGKVAVITGADSGIGKAVAILFAREGATIVLVYLNEHKDAIETASIIEKEYGIDCLRIALDISVERNCNRVIERTVARFGKIDILVNNAALHYENKKPEDIKTGELKKTFHTNIFSAFWLTAKALPYMKKGSSIINTSSVTAYRGSAQLIDYAATKGALISFTRSLAANLVDRGIRVNAVAPGPIWTPLIASSFKGSRVASHGSDAPMKRSGEPWEVATAYLFLASEDGSYYTGQVMHPNGGEIVNG